MSIEPEDLLEDALRSDLPTVDTQARVRRRLLAAGIAVGNGVAATTAAASGVGVAGAGAAGATVKLAGLSWGLKLGLAAAVAIPTVGLWLDGRAEQPAAAPASLATPPRVVETQPTFVPTPDVPSRPALTESLTEQPERQATRAGSGLTKTSAPHAAVPASDVRPSSARPSQSDFAPVEPPTPATPASSTLAEETRLLDGAFAELSAGNRARAAELIREHETRFPAGLLQKERRRAQTRLSEMSRGE